MARKEPPAGAVSAREFAALMARCGPFETRPLVAAAVSGGGDSLALALLADEWARARRGRVVALTVDHRLRPDSGAEAREVGRMLRRRGIAHRILAWDGAKPATGIQAAARAARYRLLTAWCRKEGALHLLLGHTLDDQAETVLLRLAAGSGPLGLAAMPVVQETATLRMLRPLLAVPRARLAAMLTARGQVWIEDPSNRDERFARARVRRMLAAAPEPDALRHSIAGAAAELGRFRAAEEGKIADALARAVELLPQGYARLDMSALAAAPPGIGWRALAALLATVGGLDYAPRGEAVRALFADLAAGVTRGRTLARCRLIPDGGRWLVLREARGLETVLPAAATRHVLWDGRYALTLPPGAGLAALGAEGWAQIVAHAPRIRATSIPYPARLSLPALRDRDGVAAVPALGYRRRGRKTRAITYRPRRTLVPAVFAADARA